MFIKRMGFGEAKVGIKMSIQSDKSATQIFFYDGVVAS